MNYGIFKSLVLLMLLFITTNAFANDAAKNQKGKAIYKQGEVIIKYKSHVSDKDKQEKHRIYDSKKLRGFARFNMEHATVAPGETVEQAIKRLKEDPDVEYAEPNYIRHYNSLTDGALDQVLPGESEATSGSNNAVVAIIDTGIDYNNPGLLASLWVNTDELNGVSGTDEDGNGYKDDVYGWNAVANNGNPMDTSPYHGTTVADIAASVDNNGVVKLLACKHSSNDEIYDADTIDCLHYIRTQKDRGTNIVAVNMSFGGYGGQMWGSWYGDIIDSQRDILFVAAAGNDTNDNDIVPVYPASYDVPNLVTVGSTSGDELASYSNYGKKSVDICAPSNSGTSFSAPLVCGLAALLNAQDSSRDWRTIKNLIFAGGDELPALLNKTAIGRRINVNESLNCSNRPLFKVLESPESLQPGVAITFKVLSINCGVPSGPVSADLTDGTSIVLNDEGAASDQAAGDGVFTGTWTPTVASERFSISSLAGSQSLRIPALALTDEFLPNAFLNAPYSYPVTVTGGLLAYGPLTVTSGQLPPGLYMDASSRIISGVPTATGIYTFTISVTDAELLSVSKEMTITVFEGGVYQDGVITPDYGNFYFALDDNDNVYVSAGSGTSIVTTKYDPAGTLLWSKSNTSNGYVGGIKLDTSANVHIITLNGQVIKLDKDGMLLWSCQVPGFSYLHGIAIDSAGAIYAGAAVGTSIYRTHIVKVNASGSYVGSWLFGQGVVALATDRSDNLIAIGTTSGGETNILLSKFNKDGVLQWSNVRRYTTVQAPHGLTLDESDNIYLTGQGAPYYTEYGYLYKFDPAGNQLLFRSEHMLLYGGITLDGAKNMLVTGSTSDSAHTETMWTGSYDQSGNLLWSISAPYLRGYEIALAKSSGTLFVSVSGKIIKYKMVLNMQAMSPPPGRIGVPYSYKIPVVGGQQPYTLSITAGTLPNGLSLDIATGSITGTPTERGVFPITILARDASGFMTGKSVNMTIVASPIITAGELKRGVVGNTYSVNIPLTDGLPPYNFTLVSGTLPDGLSLSTNGIITGIPTAIGVCSFDIKVTDSFGVTDTKTLSITIQNIFIKTATLPDAVANLNYMHKLEANINDVPLTWSIIEGALPPGFLLDSSTGEISGISTTLQSFSFTVKMLDASSNYDIRTYSLRVRSSDKIFAWGANWYGQLGDGSLTQRSTPVLATSLNNVIAIDGGDGHSVALKSDGTVWTSGNNEHGQLGDGTIVNRTTFAIVPNLNGVTAISAGGHSMALKSDGTVWAWGENKFGELGDGTWTQRLTPVQVINLTDVVAIAASGNTSSMALKADGTVWMWGMNTGSTPRQVDGVTNVTAIAIGTFHYMALKKDGTVWIWGGNSYGQYGDGTQTSKYPPTKVPDLYEVNAIATKANLSMALKSDGTVWTWGRNNAYRTPGDGTFTQQLVPSQVSGLEEIIAIASGSDHAVSLKSDGTVWAWGYNDYGQLGIGTLTNHLEPVQVSGIVNVSSISEGEFHSFALQAYEVPLINTVALQYGISGIELFRPLAVTGGVAPYLWSITSGALPAGLSLNASNGVVSGTPSATGTFNFSVKVTDAFATVATKSFTIAVYNPLLVSTASLPGTAVGTAYSQTLAVTGGLAPYSWTVTAGSLPEGLALNGTTGVISGNPTTAGTANFTVQVTDANTTTSSSPLSVNIINTLTIMTTTLPVATTGTAYNQTILAMGGTAPYSWSVSTDVLPTGLSLNATTGVISGTPIGTGTFNFTIKVIDANASFITKSFTIAVLAITIESLPTGTVGTAYSQALAAIGGLTPYTWSITSGSLPAGLSIDGSTGIISGTPLAAGIFSFVVQATDSNAMTISKQLSLVVYNPIVSPIIFKDDFSSGNLSNWAFVGQPNGVFNKATVNGNNLLAATGSGAASGITVETDNYSIDADVYVYDGSYGGYAVGIMFGASALTSSSSSMNAYIFEARGPGYFELEKWTYGAGWQDLGHSGTGLSPNTWTHLRVEVNGTNVKCYANTTLVFDKTLTGVQGGAGFRTYTVGAYFDNFIVSGIDTVPPVTTASPVGGTFSTAQSVTLTANEPAIIYYTLDGSIPTTASPVYTGPIAISATTTLKFFAKDTSGNSEIIKSADYAISLSIADTSLPNATFGVAYSKALMAIGGLPPYTWSITSGSLPDGLSLNSATGVLNGTSTTAGIANFTVQVTDANTTTASKALSISIINPLSITTTALPFAVTGTVSNQTLSAAGGLSPYAWTIMSGTLPTGLSLNASTGEISGTPTATGTFNFTVKATDANASFATRTLTVDVYAPLVVDTASLPTGSVGTAYSQTLTATGGLAPYTWAITAGALPDGLSLNSATGVISGTPIAVGTAFFFVQVTDANTTTVTTALSFSTVNLLSITTTTLPFGISGSTYDQTLSAAGGLAPYTWEVITGNIPSGLTLNASTGVISGTPTATGTFDFTVKATDATAFFTSKPMTIAVYAPLVIDPASLPTGTVASAYTQTLAATGGLPPYSWTIDAGTLPAGLTLNISTGVISGNPTTVGTANFTVQTTDANNTIINMPFSINIYAPLAVSTASLPDGYFSDNYNVQLGATGGVPPYTWSIISGGLLPVLELNASNGTISGLVANVGSSTFTLQVADANNTTATQVLSMNLYMFVAITTTSLPSGTIGTPYNSGLTANGGKPPYTWSVTTGSLPAGLNLAPSGGITGTPTSSGSSNFTIQVKDSNGNASSQNYTTSSFEAFKSFSIVINDPLAVTTNSLPLGNVGSAYGQTLTATGGGSLYTWSIISGSLPAGLTLTASTGVISGTPTTVETANFTVQVTDANTTASKALSISIINPLSITTTTLPFALTGTVFNQNLSAAGGLAPYTWAITAGALPDGLSLNSATGVISGTPTTVGTANFTVQATDANNATITLPFSINIHAPLVVTPVTPPFGTVGASYNLQLGATGGLAPYTWSLANGSVLPSGLTLTASTGLISGTPVQAGSFSFTVRLTDALSTVADQNLTLSVIEALILQTTSLPSGNLNVAYSQTLSAIGGNGPYTWSINGNLPTGLTLDPATGLISGTPTQVGDFSFSVTVSDSNGVNINKEFQLNISDVALQQVIHGVSGEAMAAALDAEGNLYINGYSYNQLTGNNDAVVMRYAPDGAKLAETRIDLGGSELGRDVVVDPDGVSYILGDYDGTGLFLRRYNADQSVAWTITRPGGMSNGMVLVGETLCVPEGYMNGLTSAVRILRFNAADGTPLPSFEYSGLQIGPRKKSIAADSSGNLYLSGIVSTGSANVITTVKLDPQGLALWTSSDTVPVGSTENPYGIFVDSARNSVYVAGRRLNGAYGAGDVLVVAVDAATGMKKWEATYGGTASDNAEAVVVDGSGSIYVAGGYNNSADAIVLSYDLLGSLRWAKVYDAGGTEKGYGITVDASGNNLYVVGRGGTEYLILKYANTTAAPLTISTTELPSGHGNISYSHALTATGGLAPYSWSITAGALPGGLSLNSSTGVISGSPTTAGTANFTVQVTDANAITASKVLSISTFNPLSITSTTLPSAITGTAYNQTLSATGGLAPYSWSITSGALPPGLNLSSSTGQISGSPSAAGDYSFNVMATDNANVSSTTSISLGVALSPGVAIKTVSGYFSLLRDAYSALWGSGDSGVVYMQGGDITENINFNQNISFALKGGYDTYFLQNNGYTYLHGSVTITSGMVIIENLVLLP